MELDSEEEDVVGGVLEATKSVGTQLDLDEMAVEALLEATTTDSNGEMFIELEALSATTKAVDDRILNVGCGSWPKAEQEVALEDLEHFPEFQSHLAYESDGSDGDLHHSPSPEPIVRMAQTLRSIAQPRAPQLPTSYPLTPDVSAFHAVQDEILSSSSSAPSLSPGASSTSLPSKQMRSARGGKRVQARKQKALEMAAAQEKLCLQAMSPRQRVQPLLQMHKHRLAYYH